MPADPRGLLMYSSDSQRAGVRVVPKLKLGCQKGLVILGAATYTAAFRGIAYVLRLALMMASQTESRERARHAL